MPLSLRAKRAPANRVLSEFLVVRDDFVGLRRPDIVILGCSARCSYRSSATAFQNESKFLDVTSFDLRTESFAR